MKQSITTVMFIRIWLVAGMLLVFLSGTDQARAHSFKIGFMASFSGPEKGQGRQALDGFLLATRERDGHALEESDGHLGGLDSYVIKINSNRESDAVRRQLNDLTNGQEIVFLTGVPISEMLTMAEITSGESQGIIVNPVSSVMYRSAAGNPESLLTLAEAPFSAAFRKAYGYAPGTPALAGYIAARLIDATVSAVEGNLSLRAEVQRALERASQDLR